MASTSTVDQTFCTVRRPHASLQRPGRVLRPPVVTETSRGTLAAPTAIPRGAEVTVEMEDCREMTTAAIVKFRRLTLCAFASVCLGLFLGHVEADVRVGNRGY
jgi:hypothetical protein